MANPEITAHIVVDFSSGEDEKPNVVVEIDSRETGYNNGRTSFFPGEVVHLLLYVPSGWSCTATYTSAGAVSLIKNNEQVEVSDFLTFIDDETVSLNYPLYSGFTYTWLGANLGTITVTNNECSIPKRTYDSVTNTYTPAHRAGVAKVDYVSLAHVYKLHSVPVTIEKAAVLFVVTKN